MERLPAQSRPARRSPRPGRWRSSASPASVWSAAAPRQPRPGHKAGSPPAVGKPRRHGCGFALMLSPAIGREAAVTASSQKTYLGLDVGTSSVKALLIDADQKVV